MTRMTVTAARGGAGGLVPGGEDIMLSCLGHLAAAVTPMPGRLQEQIVRPSGTRARSHETAERERELE
eukprot:COSAG01_NODE_130_length_24912_cov_83.574175_8_plen_68_part_00